MQDATAQPEATTELGSDAEAALWAQLEKEDSADETVDEVSEPEGDAEPADAEAEAPDAEAEQKKEPLPYEELAKRHKDLQGALHAERAKARQMAERASNMDALLRELRQSKPSEAEQKPAAPQIPDINEDPIGHFQAKSALLEQQIAELTKGSQSAQEQFQRQRAEQQFWGQVSQSEAQMRASTPDYDDAVGHLEASRVAELEAIYPDDSPQAIDYALRNGFQSTAQLRAHVLNQDRISVATQALQMGMNPAQLYYNLAVQRGYQKAAPKTNVTPIAAARNGQRAAKSLSAGGGGRADAMPSLDALADMYLDDPDAADRMFAKLKASGQLG